MSDKSKDKVSIYQQMAAQDEKEAFQVRIATLEKDLVIVRNNKKDLLRRYRARDVIIKDLRDTLSLLRDVTGCYPATHHGGTCCLVPKSEMQRWHGIAMSGLIQALTGADE